jgi:hypothetical protein
MTMLRNAFVVLAVFAASAPAQETAGPLDAKAGFAMLKKLAGAWETTPAKSGDAKSQIQYKVTAKGSAVVETISTGTEEMISVYHMDGPDAIVMTHYCAAGNQPTLRLGKSAKPAELKFAFAGGTNIDPKKDGYVHDLTIQFLRSDQIRAEYVSYAGGKKAESTVMLLSRKK